MSDIMSEEMRKLMDQNDELQEDKRQLEKRLMEYQAEANAAFAALEKIGIAAETIKSVRHLEKHHPAVEMLRADSAIAQALSDIRAATKQAWDDGGRLPF